MQKKNTNPAKGNYVKLSNRPNSVPAPRPTPSRTNPLPQTPSLPKGLGAKRNNFQEQSLWNYLSGLHSPSLSRLVPRGGRQSSLQPRVGTYPKGEFSRRGGGVDTNEPVNGIPAREIKNEYDKEKKSLKGDASEILKGVASVAAAYGAQTTNTAPTVKEYRKKGVQCRLVKHREYIGDFSGTPDFTTFAYDMNPASQDTFPWLASEATLWQYYSFKKLRFDFNTSQGTSVAGVVMAAMTFDPAEPIPANKQAMLNYNGAKRSVAWQALSIDAPKVALTQVANRNVGRGFPLDLLSTENLTSDEVASSLDPRFSSAGRLVVATEGYSTTIKAVGELYVEYEVELSEPRPASLAVQSCAINGGAGSTVADLLPAAEWNFAPGNLAIYPDQGAGAAPNTLYISQPGQYLVNFVLVGTTITFDPSPGAPRFFSSISGDVNTYGPISASTTTWGGISRQLIEINDSDNLISVESSVAGGTITQFNIYIVRVAPGSMGLATT